MKVPFARMLLVASMGSALLGCTGTSVRSKIPTAAATPPPDDVARFEQLVKEWKAANFTVVFDRKSNDKASQSVFSQQGDIFRWDDATLLIDGVSMGIGSDVNFGERGGFSCVLNVDKPDYLADVSCQSRTTSSATLGDRQIGWFAGSARAMRFERYDHIAGVDAECFFGDIIGTRGTICLSSRGGLPLFIDSTVDSDRVYNLHLSATSVTTTDPGSEIETPMLPGDLSAGVSKRQIPITQIAIPKTLPIANDFLRGTGP